MDNNTPENLLDAAKAMHHSQEMQLAAYQKILNETSLEFTELSDSDSYQIVGGAMPPYPYRSQFSIKTITSLPAIADLNG